MSCPTPQKISYPTEMQARAAATFYKQRHYECPCGEWHTTTTAASRKLLKKRKKPSGTWLHGKPRHLKGRRLDAA